jgi:hypothetical protein
MRTVMNFLAAYRRVSPPVLWDGWEAYYHIMHYEGDRSADVK